MRITGEREMGKLTMNTQTHMSGIVLLLILSIPPATASSVKGFVGREGSMSCGFCDDHIAEIILTLHGAKWRTRAPMSLEHPVQVQRFQLKPRPVIYPYSLASHRIILKKIGEIHITTIIQ